MFSTQNVDIYNKFKLQDGNLYMNNQRVGIEEFSSGKNIEISNHLFHLSDSLNISGDIVVDNDVYVNGTIFAEAIDMDFFEVNGAKINALEATDISAEHILGDDLVMDIGDHLQINSNTITLSAEEMYFNGGMTILKNHTRTNDVDPENTFEEIVEVLQVDNLEILNSIKLPSNVSAGLTVSGEFIANSDLTVKGVLYSNLRIDASGTNDLSGINTITGTNTMTGTTNIDYLELENGIFEDISVANLNVTNACDVMLGQNEVFRIRKGFDFSMTNIYDWGSDISNNLYYDRGNIVIGKITGYDIDASLNVRGPVHIEGDLDMDGYKITFSSFSSSSDVRLKSNISDLENGLDIIRKIKPKLYDKKCGSGHIRESGVIAQDILEIDELNYMVDEHKGMYGLNYNSLHMYSLLAIQELDKKMDRLTESIEKSMGLTEQKLNILYKMRR